MITSDDTTLLVVAGAGLIGNTVAVFIGAWLTNLNARRAHKDTLAAVIATKAAEENSFKAQASAAKAAEDLVHAARATDDRLRHMESLAEETRIIATRTHHILDGDRVRALRQVVDLLQKISDDHPKDDIARRSLMKASDDLRFAVENYKASEAKSE